MFPCHHTEQHSTLHICPSLSSREKQLLAGRQQWKVTVLLHSRLLHSCVAQQSPANGHGHSNAKVSACITCVLHGIHCCTTILPPPENKQQTYSSSSKKRPSLSLLVHLSSFADTSHCSAALSTGHASDVGPAVWHSDAEREGEKKQCLLVSATS